MMFDLDRREMRFGFVICLHVPLSINLNDASDCHWAQGAKESFDFRWFIYDWKEKLQQFDEADDRAMQKLKKNATTAITIVGVISFF